MAGYIGKDLAYPELDYSEIEITRNCGNCKQSEYQHSVYICLLMLEIKRKRETEDGRWFDTQVDCDLGCCKKWEGE